MKIKPAIFTCNVCGLQAYIVSFIVTT